MNVAIQSAYPLTVASLTGPVSLVNPITPRSLTLQRSYSSLSNLYKLLRSSNKSASPVLRTFQTLVRSCAAPISNGVNMLQTARAMGRGIGSPRTQPSNKLSLFLSWLSFCDRLCLFSTLSALFLQNRGGIYPPATRQPRICLPNHPD
jgi:hypothetical protein